MVMANRIYSWIGRGEGGKKEGRTAGFLVGFSLPRWGGLGGRGFEREDQRFGCRCVKFGMPG